MSEDKISYLGNTLWGISAFASRSNPFQMTAQSFQSSVMQGTSSGSQTLRCRHITTWLVWHLIGSCQCIFQKLRFRAS